MFVSDVSAYSDTYLAFGILHSRLTDSWKRRGMIGAFRWAPSNVYVRMENFLLRLLGDMQLRIVLRVLVAVAII